MWRRNWVSRNFVLCLNVELIAFQLVSWSLLLRYINCHTVCVMNRVLWAQCAALLESHFAIGTKGNDTGTWRVHLQETTGFSMTEEFIKVVSSTHLKILVVVCGGVILCFFLNWLYNPEVFGMFLDVWKKESKTSRPWIFYNLCHVVQWFEYMVWNI